MSTKSNYFVQISARILCAFFPLTDTQTLLFPGDQLDALLELCYDTHVHDPGDASPGGCGMPYVVIVPTYNERKISRQSSLRFWRMAMPFTS